MTEYTPTMYDVRDVWCNWAPHSQREAGNEFDRWLAAHDADIRADEREKAEQRVVDAFMDYYGGVSSLRMKIVAAARGGVSDEFRTTLHSEGGEQE